MVIVDTLTAVPSSDDNVPFRYFRYPYQSDSIKVAVNVIADYLQTRDSTVINITGLRAERLQSGLIQNQIR